MAYDSSNPMCPVCGQPVPQPGGRGRPRLYHPECQDVGRLLGWLESKAVALAGHLNPRRREHLSGVMRRLASDVEGASVAMPDPSQLDMME